MPQQLVVVGGGFAGLWAAASAARLRAAKGIAPERLAITLVAPDPFHVIRVRCYEEDLSDIRIPLDDVLAPIGVARVEGRVSAIDVGQSRLAIEGVGDALRYDRLVLAPGSALARPDALPEAVAFDVDTVAGAERLAAHLAALPASPHPGRWTALVVGAGLVGLEIACELHARLERVRETTGDPGPARVLLVDHSPEIGAAMGAAALPAIRQALAAGHVEARPGLTVRSATRDGAVLSDGAALACATIVCATGQRASPLVAALPVAHDALGRVPVDAFLAVEGLPGLYAAGDAAAATADPQGHRTVMSCQHARPMGRLAGHNAACDLIGCTAERIPFAAPDYVTVLDLGRWGAVYTSGWDRSRVVAEGTDAKAVKRVINHDRIVPPRDRDAAAILEAAAPLIQQRPALDAGSRP